MQITVSLLIVILTCIVSYMAFQNRDLKYKLMFIPYNAKHSKEHYRFLSHVLIHADYMHLFFNMFVLYSFGKGLEFEFSVDYGVTKAMIHFLILYVGGGLFSTLWSYSKHQDNPNYMALGASGAVSSVVFAMILWMPKMKMGLLFIPFEIRAWLFGALYLGFEYYMAKKGNTKIGHDAHFVGAVFGIGYVLLINFDKGKEFISAIFG